MRNFLIILFSIFLLAMLAMTIVASLDRSVFNVGQEMLQDKWFQATLLDAYLGFLTFYVWVAYKETTWAGKLIWFVLIMTLGNMAMAGYVLIQLFRLKPDEPCSNILVRTTHP